MHLETLPRAIATLDTDRLRALRNRLEVGLLAEMPSATIAGTTAHLRRIAVMTAAGAEVARRMDKPRTTPFDTCWVDGVRLSFQVRVF